VYQNPRYQNSSGTNITINTVSEANWITITKIQSPQTLLGGEVVAMRATLSADASVNNAVIPFDTVDFDTHDGLDTSTGVYTIKKPGKYRITTSSLITTGAQNSVSVRKNSSTVQIFFLPTGNTMLLNTSNSVDCIAGDTIDVFTPNNVTYDAASLTGNHCSFEIEKIN
jgi:hypothetical protein